LSKSVRPAQPSKEQQAPGSRQWADGEFARALQPLMAELTDARNGPAALSNAKANLRHLKHGKSLAALRGDKPGKSDRAVIIAAGPSIYRNDPFPALKRHQYDGLVIATDSALLRCLRNDVVPDLVVTVDPHDPSIVRWFGDPALSQAELDGDDYFRRQDMDTLFRDEMRTNREIMERLDKVGKQVRIALATSAGERVVQRAVQTGMQIYWFNPMLDDPDLPHGKTRALIEMNRLPCVNCGGNVGTACWMIADAVLGARHVALTGIDFSYYEDTPYYNTQYYHEAIEIVGKEGLDGLFVRIYNPHAGKWFYTDPAYLWFRDAFLDLASEASCITYNCTGGGILFGGSVRTASIEDFIRADAKE